MTRFHFPKPWQLPEREATPEQVFLDRRQIVRGLGLGSLAMALPGADRGLRAAEDPAAARVAPAVGKLYSDRFPATRNEAYDFGGRPLTPEEKSSAYNNFYEFTTAKDRVWELARDYPVNPWQVKVHGLVKKPMTLDLDDIFTRFPLEERLYRFRCVERWAMQIPWTGFPLKALVDHLDPLPSARWIRFGTVLDKEGLPGQKAQTWYPWPYYEGLRLDEAKNDLAFVAVGTYGHALPMQHGAPWRIATPWKYGYKSPKSIVEIELTKKRPRTFWNDLQPAEYGFFSNVDPGKPHPRWSQKWEQDIGSGETRSTELYNGYAEQVGGLYDGDEI